VHLSEYSIVPKRQNIPKNEFLRNGYNIIEVGLYNNAGDEFVINPSNDLFAALY
jgi:chitinase